MNPLGAVGWQIKLIAGALLLVALAVGVYLYDAHEQELGATKIRLAQAQSQEVEHQRIAQENFRNNELAGTLAANQAERKVVYATIANDVDRIVDRPIYLADCFDADGMRNLAAAIAGKAADPGVVASALRAPAAAGEPPER